MAEQRPGHGGTDAKRDTTGTRLQRLREHRGLSKAGIGRAVGVSGQSVGYYERDESLPSGMVLLNLSEFFRVSTAYLLCITDDPMRKTDLPPEWERLVNDLMRDEYTPDKIRRAIELLAAAERIAREKREG